VYDLPTRFDPALVSKLDPHLEEDLERQGFRVTGYRLELIGYRDQASMPAHPRHQAEVPSGPAIRPFLSDGNENQG
jgi:hypothetical protein